MQSPPHPKNVEPGAGAAVTADRRVVVEGHVGEIERAAAGVEEAAALACAARAAKAAIATVAACAALGDVTAERTAGEAERAAAGVNEATALARAACAACAERTLCAPWCARPR